MKTTAKRRDAADKTARASASPNNSSTSGSAPPELIPRRRRRPRPVRAAALACLLLLTLAAAAWLLSGTPDRQLTEEQLRFLTTGGDGVESKGDTGGTSPTAPTTVVAPPGLTDDNDDGAGLVVVAPVADGPPLVVSLVMPSYQSLTNASLTEAQLMESLLGTLVDREAALCYTRRTQGSTAVAINTNEGGVIDSLPSSAADVTSDDGTDDSLEVVAAPRARLEVVVVTNLSPAAPAFAALRARLAVEPEDTPDGVAWTAAMDRVRSAVAKSRGATMPASIVNGSSCYGARVTLVSVYGAPVGDRMTKGASGSHNPPLIYPEFYLAAGLRTVAGAAGPFVLVLPAHVVPTMAPYASVVDERRRPPRGFLESMLVTAMNRNRGRVAAVQCGLLRHDPPVKAEEGGGEGGGNNRNTRLHVPVPLSLRQLDGYAVVDRGGFVSAASGAGSVLPFLARRHAGLRGSDQRFLFEEPIGGASLHCGLFHRRLLAMAGGLPAALKEYPTLASYGGEEATTAAAAAGAGAMRGIHHAADSAGWKLSLLMQRMRPSWQVFASRAVGVWVPTATLINDGAVPVLSPLEIGLREPLFALADGYGRAHSATLQLLQARRFGVAWRDRLRPIDYSKGPAGVDRGGVLPPELMLPPVMTYSVDFPCACCGLAREAAGYIRPLMDRYAVGVAGDRDYCGRAGAAMLNMAYERHRRGVFGKEPPDTATQRFWAAQAAARVPVAFLHARAHRYRRMPRPPAAAPYSLSIGRSLSEFSNVPTSWVQPLRSGTDQVWVTAEFFRDLYRRQGVPDAKIRTVPEAVDAYEYDPANLEPLPLPLRAGQLVDNMPHLSPAERQSRYVFLSMFKWELRKGWDVLLSAYHDAFGPNAPPELRNRTTLILKVNLKTRYSRGLSVRNIGSYLRQWARDTGSIPRFTGLESLPHIVIIAGGFSNTDLARLYRSADAFVFPSRGEGWGLPASEAMTMGLPLIMTPWSGLTGFITDDTCFQIPLDGLEEIPQQTWDAYGFEAGKKWALPSRNGTADLMRYVVAHPEHAREVGRRGRQLVLQRFSEEAVADTMDREIADYLIAQAAAKGNKA